MDARDYFVREHRKALEKAQEINEKSAPNDDEAQAAIAACMKTANEFKAEIDNLDRQEATRQAIADMTGPVIETKEVTQPTAGDTPGGLFVKSDGYRKVKEAGFGGENWSTGQVEVPNFFDEKATMSGTASPNVLVPQYQSGIRQLTGTLTNRVAGLMPNLTTDNNSIKYFIETTATNATAAVAEAAEKPENTLIANLVTVDIRKLASVTRVTDEFLDDVPGVESYINTRMAGFLSHTEQVQLLSGDGTTPNISGFLDTDRAIPTGSALSLDADNSLDAILMAITKVRVDGEAEPTAIVIHPYDYHRLRTLKDTAKQYYGGGPFTGAYGNGPIPGAPVGPDIWQYNTVITPAIPEGTVLLGDFAQHAAVWRKGGVSLSVTNSHSTDFVFNITALRIEERLGLAIYRPAAFYIVTALTGLIS